MLRVSNYGLMVGKIVMIQDLLFLRKARILFVMIAIISIAIEIPAIIVSIILMS